MLVLDHVPTSRLATLMGVSRTTIWRLTRDGVLKQSAPGCYDAGAAVQGYLAWLDANRRTDKVAEAESSLRQEKVRRLRAENDRVEAGLISAGEARAVARVTLAAMASSLASKADRLAPELAALTDAAVIKERLQDAARDALNACADRLEQAGAAQTSPKNTARRTP